MSDVTTPVSLTSESPARRRYSIRTLLTATAICGIALALYLYVPHIAILLTGLLVAWAATVRMTRCYRTPQPLSKRTTTTLTAFAACGFFYVASFGPVVMLCDRYKEFDRDSMAVLYAPVGLIAATPPLDKPFSRYVRMWSSSIPLNDNSTS